MIIDALSNLKNYTSLNPLFQDVVDFIENNDLKEQPQGIQNFKGDGLYANFSLANGKTKEQARLETHNVMVDIQIPIDSDETMGYIPREKLAPADYNEQKDITFYDGQTPDNYITVHKGEFAIFFPQDGHAPCISDKEKIQKVIFKIKAV